MRTSAFLRWKDGPPRWPDEVTVPFLRMERGFVDEDTTDESIRGLNRRECASCAACEGGMWLYIVRRKVKVQHLAQLPSHQGWVVPTPRRARRLHRSKVRGHIMQRRQDWQHLG